MAVNLFRFFPRGEQEFPVDNYSRVFRTIVDYIRKNILVRKSIAKDFYESLDIIEHYSDVGGLSDPPNRLVDFLRILDEVTKIVREDTDRLSNGSTSHVLFDTRADWTSCTVCGFVNSHDNLITSACVDPSQKQMEDVCQAIEFLHSKLAPLGKNLTR